MGHYVDGFVIPLPKKNLRAYVRISRAAGKVWKEHGALEYRECVGEDLANQMPRSFPRQMKAKRGETVVFSYIVYRSRAHRDQVNARVMKDPRMERMTKKPMPFDCTRMACGGFEVLVEA